VSITTRFDGRQRLAIVAGTVILVTVLAATLAVRGYHSLLEETFRERSLSYVQAFAASASAWIDPLDVEMLRTASRFLLVGSASYVLIDQGRERVVDERVEDTAALDLPGPDNPPTSAGEASLPIGSSILDIVVPLLIAGEAVGTVRIGIGTASIAARSRGLSMTAGGIAFGVDVLVLALLFWSHRGSIRRRRAAPAGAAPMGGSTVPSEAIVVGNLRIDGATKTATWKEQPIDLTPKQYALLDFLARRPDRVISEREIVNAVWAESTYADSKDVKQYVYLLRKRLAAVDPRGRELIVTVPGFGYRLTPSPVDEGLTDG
jgi:DNA-binding winged helix-turn-helix (wHTH) protein